MFYYKPIGFINTVWTEQRGIATEPLRRSEWLKYFFKYVTEQEPGQDLTEDGLETLKVELVKLRSEIILLLDQIHSPDFLKEAEVLLRPYVLLSHGRRSIVEGEEGKLQVTFVPAKADENYLLSELALSWVDLIFKHDYTRIKMCEDPGCTWYFYDESKSKTKRHCTPNCGNRMKVRRHRQKDKS